METKLYKETNGKFVLLFFFNDDVALETPVARVEVSPVKSSEVWIFEKFYTALLDIDGKEIKKNA